ncbi:MAG: tyrosine-type recombinase/integrase [Bifidobacterium sp.]|nr:tyrosine-type recombinase/integrase [Bifidobacterium sp.]
MDASIQPYTLTSGKKQYYVKWRDADGKQHTKRSFKTKREAKDFVAELATETAAGTWVDPQNGRTTVGRLGPTWLTSKKGTVKDNYWHNLETAWRVHVEPRWGKRPLRSILHSDVQAWVSEMAQERSATTVRRAYGVLSEIMATAMADKLIKSNPCEGIRLPKREPGRREYLTLQQVLSLADAAGEYRPLVLVLALCGLRYGEARALRVRDIDFKAGRLQVAASVSRRGGQYFEGAPKTWERRSVPAAAYVLDALRDHVAGRDADALVFEGHSSGGYIGDVTKGGRNWYARALKASGVPPLRVHDLRHTAASIAISAGANVKAVQRMLGHQTAAMTLDTYADLFDTDLDAVAANIDAKITAVRTF